MLGRQHSTGTNSTYPKLAVQWLNQTSCFYESLCLVDSEVFRNRPQLVLVTNGGQVRDSSPNDKVIGKRSIII